MRKETISVSERALLFAEDGPTENGYLYCPFCGKKIHVEE